MTKPLYLLGICVAISALGLHSSAIAQLAPTPAQSDTTVPPEATQTATETAQSGSVQPTSATDSPATTTPAPQAQQPSLAHGESVELAPAPSLRPEELPTPTKPTVPSYKNRLSFSPLPLFLGIISLTYERGLGKHFSLEANPLGMFLAFDDWEMYGAGGLLGASFYFTGDAPRGLRLRLAAGAAYFGGSNIEDSLFVNEQVTVGYNWVWNGGMSIGLGGGVQYLHISKGSDRNNFVLPTADFTIGFAF